MKKHNPWIATLWIVAIVLVTAAFSANVWLVTLYSSPQPGPDQDLSLVFLLQLVDAMKFPALLIGFATISGLLFLHARNRARRVRVKKAQD